MGELELVEYEPHKGGIIAVFKFPRRKRVNGRGHVSMYAVQAKTVDDARSLANDFIKECTC